MKAPLITMSAVTGRPTRQEIFEYMNSIKTHGIDQAMVYPRSGCEMDYLEEGWFTMAGHFVDAAKELDMCLWFYDDFNWPSGDAHGRVSKIPQYRLKSVCTKGENLGKIDFYSKNKGSIFGEKYFPDLLGDKAMDYFIECTHEQYYKHFGQYFGTLIKGIFTDEPGVGYCCNEESMPYYDGMAEDYKNECGRDFHDDMKNSHPDFYGISLELIGKQYRKCFLGKISDWCRKHGIALTGHLMEDTTPAGATKQCGDILKALSCFDVPGIDELRTRFDDIAIYNLLGTVQYGRREKKGAMAELFALGPCDLALERRRNIIYLASCFGINNYFLAISPLDMRGNMSITDYFNIFSADCPDFESMKFLAEDAKKASLLAQKEFTPRVYIRYPTKICAKHINDNLNIMRFFKLVNYFTYNQIPWKYVDEGDDTANIPVIEFTEELEYLLKGEKITLDEAVEKFKASPRVTDENGNINNGIFVREYNDGTTVVLNLFGTKGVYLVDGKKVYLEENAVRVYNGNVEEYKPENKIGVNPEFCVKYRNDNMVRTMYVNEASEAKVVCQKEQKVRFAVRNDVSAELNGEKIMTPFENSEYMSNGLKKLYRVSEQITLEKGNNTVTSENDRKYLPSVFVIGDFACESKGASVCTVTLSERKTLYKLGEELCDFGCAELNTEIEIPEKAYKLELEGAVLYTKLYIDEEYIADAVYNPFVFDIPKKYRGKKVKLKLEQYSSIGPVFGDVDYYTENSTTTNWKTPAPGKARFGAEKINFVVE